jgi:hexosaminidase
MSAGSAAAFEVGRSAGLLIPRPKRVRASGGAVALPRALRILVRGDAALNADVERFGERIASAGFSIERTQDGSDAHVRVAVDPAASDRAGGYRLTVSHGGVEAIGQDAAGAWYALCTLAQLLEVTPRAAGAALPELEIADAPDFAARGLMLDVSRTKVPTMETLRAIADLCAHLKLNQLQLYTEHTFAYAGHERVWRDASPITPVEARELDRWCRERHIELVPNQQSFGHMHRWLEHDAYRALAEVPDGIEHAFSRERSPYGLCATDPQCLALVAELFDQLLPNFSSGLANAGLDEAVDLGLGRSKVACDKLGRGRVYLEYLRAVHGLLGQRGRRMQFWGDLVVEHPELARELPRDAIALEWGYEANHPFADRTRLFAESGLEFYVCPGTSSWQSIAGRARNAIANTSAAALHGARAGASGYLVTDWGDRGHLQPLAASYLGIAAAAARAWNAAPEDARENWGAELDAHVFRDADAAVGRIALELGDVYLDTGARSTNGSALFFLLAFADESLPHPRMPGLTREGLERALARSTRSAAKLDAMNTGSAECRISASELCWSAELLAFACRFGIARLSTPEGAPVSAMTASDRRRLIAELEPLIVEHRRAWLVRNRPGGLDESASWLERVAALLDDGRIASTTSRRG